MVFHPCSTFTTFPTYYIKKLTQVLLKFEAYHKKVRQNIWLHYFSIFNRVALAAGFIPAGIVKIMGQRFADGLSVIHPMGHYLEALSFTGYYYTFIGVVQTSAGLLLLIPRTVALGAVLYFPIILNITILSFAVRFDGSLLTSPLMTLSCLFLLLWNFDKLKFILPVKPGTFQRGVITEKPSTKTFPFKFFIFSGVAFASVITLVYSMNKFTIMPRNSLQHCKNQFEEKPNEDVGFKFCECVHVHGNPLNECLELMENKSRTHY